MSPDDAVERLNATLSHAWMIRTFLKHAEEIQENVEMLDVPRTLYDSIRAVEPALERGDVPEYLRRLKGKLAKIRRVAFYFRDHYKEFSPHTNYAMASASLLEVVRRMEEIFADVVIPPPVKVVRDPIDELEIPEV